MHIRYHEVYLCGGKDGTDRRIRGAREKGDVFSLLVLDPDEVLLSTVLAREMVPGLMSTMEREIVEGVQPLQLPIPSGSPHEFIGNAGEH